MKHTKNKMIKARFHAPPHCPMVQHTGAIRRVYHGSTNKGDLTCSLFIPDVPHAQHSKDGAESNLEQVSWVDRVKLEDLNIGT